MRLAPVRGFGPPSLRALAREAARTLLCAAALAAAGAGAAAAKPEKVAGGIRFTYRDAAAKSVSWAGAFNSWNTTANAFVKEGEVWAVTLPLGVGEHQYKFVVDGAWITDPENPATAGDYGNSVVSVGSGGELVAVAPSSNTPFSPKIMLNGRGIGLYQVVRDPADGRYQLYRPNFDVDLDWGIRIADFLRARFLLNFNSAHQDAELFRSNLNFDRGSLEFTQPRFQIFAYDEDAAGTWDDPLHLVGNVGIYNYPYGFERQGFRVRSSYLKTDVELHYADNFQPGNPSYPPFPEGAFDAVIAALSVRPTSAGFELAPDQERAALSYNFSDNNEDMIAVRAGRDVWRGLRLGALGRMDRGFNFGWTTAAFPTAPTRFRVFEGTSQQLWYAYGAEARWKLPRGFEAFGEYLRGRLKSDVLSGNEFDYEVDQADSAGILSAFLTDLRPTSSASLTLDESDRFRVGATWTEAHGDVVAGADVEYQDHVYRFVGPGLDNSLVHYRLHWNRNWRYYLNREVKTGLEVDYADFSYRPGTPWSFQLWFPAGNFWLEHRETKVSVDRFALLGGNDVISARPSLELPFYRPRNATFRYRGIVNTVDLGNRPKFLQSVFELGCDLSPALRFQTNTRWAKYDDPVLELDDGYVSHFAELAYKFSPQIQVSLSYGVDPWVVDENTNEYAEIGRDQFLFDRGATESMALSNYYGLGPTLEAAEKALRDDRRFQVEAIVRF